MFGEMGLSKIWFSEYEQKLQGGLEPRIYSSQARYFNHWAIMIFEQIDRYNI